MQKYVFRNCLLVDEIPSYVRGWADKMGSDFCKVYEIGTSGGYPIMVAEMSDPSVPDCEKERVVLTAQHTLEVSGVNTIFSVGNFLAARGELAREILRKQTIYLVPCPNMFSYATRDFKYQFRNAAGIDEYNAFSDDLTVDPEKAPAAYALKCLIDEVKPELFIDAHGVWYNDCGCLECTGAYSFANLNYTFDRSFVDSMNAAAERKGYAVFSEDFLQNLRSLDPICQRREYYDRFRLGAPSVLAGTYAYIKYHTLSLNMEVIAEESGVLRIVEALRLGCQPIWHVNGFGYPVRIVRAPMVSSSLLCADGCAKKRRESRIELWNQTCLLGHGVTAPEGHGLQGVMVSTCHDYVNKVLGPGGVYPLAQVFDKLEKSGMELSKVRELYKNVVEHSMMDCNWKREGEQAVLKYGYTIRFALILPDVKPKNVLLNGKTLSKEEYIVFKRGNFTYLEIPVADPPKLAFAVVEYDCTRFKAGIIEY